MAIAARPFRLISTVRCIDNPTQGTKCPCSDMTSAPNQWVYGSTVWARFTNEHPEFGYRTGLWSFHNFLRVFRAHLLSADAVRRAARGHWIAHVGRFPDVAFECASGKLPPAPLPARHGAARVSELVASDGAADEDFGVTEVHGDDEVDRDEIAADEALWRVSTQLGVDAPDDWGDLEWPNSS